MKKQIIVVIAAMTLLLTGCFGKDTATQVQKTVKVTPAKTMEYNIGLNYLGIVRAKDTKNYSFLSGGKLEEVYVKAGDEVKTGDPLAKLDTSTLEISINTARTTVNSLKDSVDTAKSALDASAVLHTQGFLSDKDWESQNNQFTTLTGNYDIAVNNLKLAEKNLKESTLYASEDGYVMEVPYKAGEVIGSGYPAVVLKGSQKVVTIGISTDDIMGVTYDNEVAIDGSVSGKVDSIGQYPDESTRTYPVDISFVSDQYVIGDMVDVEIIMGKDQGCFVPVSSVFNVDGLNYVYIVDDKGLISRKQVTLGDLKEDMVKVEGVEEGMSVINDGIKNIRENEIVAANSTGTENKLNEDNKK